MGTKPKPATRKYVDEAAEAACRYSDSLFAAARERVEMAEKHMLEKAIQTIRPAPTVQPASTGWTRLTIDREPDGRLHISLR